MMNAAQAIVGPLELEERASLLGEHEQFAGCNEAQLEDLATYI